MSTQNRPALHLLQLELEAIRRSLSLANLSPAEVQELRQRLRRLQNQVGSGATSGNGKAPAEDHLLSFAAPTRPTIQRSPKARRRRRGPRLARFVAAVHFALDLMLQALFGAFLVLFALQFPHPEKWNSWWWVVGLRQIMDPLLTNLDDALEWPEAAFYYPFALALLMQAGRMVLNLNLRPLQERLQRMPAKIHR